MPDNQLHEQSMNAGNSLRPPRAQQEVWLHAGPARVRFGLRLSAGLVRPHSVGFLTPISSSKPGRLSIAKPTGRLWSCRATPSTRDAPLGRGVPITVGDPVQLPKCLSKPCVPYLLRSSPRVSSRCSVSARCTAPRRRVSASFESSLFRACRRVPTAGMSLTNCRIWRASA